VVSRRRPPDGPQAASSLRAAANAALPRTVAFPIKGDTQQPGVTGSQLVSAPVGHRPLKFRSCALDDFLPGALELVTSLTVRNDLGQFL
jgi:hypothetical protein